VFLANLLGFRLGGIFMSGGWGYYGAMGAAGAAGVLHLMGCVSLAAGARTRSTGLGAARVLVVVLGIVLAAALAVGFYAPGLLGPLNSVQHRVTSALVQIGALGFLLALGAVLAHIARTDDEAGRRDLVATTRNLGLFS